MFKRLALLGAVGAALMVAGCGGGDSQAQPCGKVSPETKQRLADGVNGTLQGPVYYVPTDHAGTPWVFAASMTGDRVALWATDLDPKNPDETAFIQSLNRDAWEASEWGTVGDFDDNFPMESISTQPDDSAASDARDCL